MAKNEFEEINNLLESIGALDNRVLELVAEMRNIVETQSEAIATLKDENESLWFMLEEMKNSDIAEWAKHGDNASKLQDRVDDTLGRLAILVNSLSEA
jgi:hypothetical protein